ncbi:MAG TPA: tetratricopeptide repeat protein [Puia sp.]|nr:tetratricopeptide repeat protein [Puia sp.]
MNDVKVIKARSEIIIERYFNNLLNTISYTGAESTEIKELINRSFEDSAKQLFLNGQIAVADDISDPDYSNSSNSPEVPVTRYLNAFNTFYGKSDANSVFFSDIRSSPVKRGKRNIYINVYFTSLFKNICLSKPSTPYKPTKRVAEIFIKKSTSNKWLLYISRIGFFNPADTLNDFLDNIAIADANKQSNSSGSIDETADPANKFSQYIDQARLEEKKRNYQTAINLYSRAIDLEPEKRDIYEARIKELNTSFRVLVDLDEKYRAGYYKDAIKGYSELLKNPKLNTDYSNSDYYLGRAKCFDKMGQLTRSYNEQVKNYNDALNDYAKSYEYDNDNLETIRCRADLYRRMNRNVEALTEYRTYLAKDPTDPSVYEAMANLHMLNGNLDQAIKDSDPALSQGNIDPISKSKLNIEKGVLYAQKNDYSSAEVYFTRAIALDSNNAFSYYDRGMVRIKLNKIQSAASDLISARQKGFGSTNIIKIDSSAQLIFERGVYALNIGNYDSALIFIDAAINVNPNKSYYYYARGECYFSKKDFGESIKAYSLAIGLLTNYSEAYYKRGMADLQLGKATDGIADFTRAVQYNPQLYLAQKGIGDAYFVLKDYKKCATSLEACLEMNSLREAHSPKTIMEIYTTIGKAYYQIKNYPKALENYRKFLAFHPNEIPSSFNYEIGNIYMNIGKYDSANSYLMRSYQSDPSNGYILYSMASCIYLRGNTNESLKWFERSFKTNALERSFVDHDTLLGSLQNDKRFKDLKKKYL